MFEGHSAGCALGLGGLTCASLWVLLGLGSSAGWQWALEVAVSKASTCLQLLSFPTPFQFALSLQALLLLGSPPNGGEEEGRPAPCTSCWNGGLLFFLSCLVEACSPLTQEHVQLCGCAERNRGEEKRNGKLHSVLCPLVQRPRSAAGVPLRAPQKARDESQECWFFTQILAARPFLRLQMPPSSVVAASRVPWVL